MALIGHACAKQSWIGLLCTDGSTPLTTAIPFAIQTEFHDGEAVYRRTYVGACGIYKLAWSTTMPIVYSGTRHCYVPKLIEIDGSNLVLTIRDTNIRFVHLSGFVQSASDFESAIKVLDERDWAGSTRAYIDIEIGESGLKRRLWHAMPKQRKTWRGDATFY